MIRGNLLSETKMHKLARSASEGLHNIPFPRWRFGLVWMLFSSAFENLR